MSRTTSIPRARSYSISRTMPTVPGRRRRLPGQTPNSWTDAVLFPDDRVSALRHGACPAGSGGAWPRRVPLLRHRAVSARLAVVAAMGGVGLDLSDRVCHCPVVSAGPSVDPGSGSEPDLLAGPAPVLGPGVLRRVRADRPGWVLVSLAADCADLVGHAGVRRA